MISAPEKTDASPVAVEARCVRLLAKADDPPSISPLVERRSLSRAANEVLIEVKAAAVNPSDVKAATGLMPYAVFPRTPGRDYAGVTRSSRSRKIFRGRRPRASAFPSSPRWKVFVAPERRRKARPCW
jgi:hypothetical protein